MAMHHEDPADLNILTMALRKPVPNTFSVFISKFCLQTHAAMDTIKSTIRSWILQPMVMCSKLLLVCTCYAINITFLISFQLIAACYLTGQFGVALFNKYSQSKICWSISLYSPP